MIKREPELLSLVELSVATEQARQGEPLDVKAFCRHVRRALRHERQHAVEKDLRVLRDAATRLAEAGDWPNAGALYHALLEESVRGYDDKLREIDEDGDISILIDEFAQGLSRCLTKSEVDGQTRRAWLEALPEAELVDIEMGGIDLAPSAREAVLEHTSDEAWTWIEKQIGVAISKSSDWGRVELARFLAQGQKRRGRTGKAATPKRKKT